MTEQSVQLHEAFCFRCPKCGYQNLVHGVILDDPIAQEAAEKMMYDQILNTQGESAAAEFDGQVMVSPDRVTCSSCQTSYPVEHPEMLSFFDDDPIYDPDLEDDDDFDDERDDSEEWGDDDDFDDDEDDFDEEVDEDEYDLRGPIAW